MLKDVKNKSGFIAEAIQDRIEQEKKVCLIKELTEGYKASKREDKQLTEDWGATAGDGVD